MDLLNGIKIVDFTRLLPGPVATHMLAQMGAEVIKIESPKRLDYVREMGVQKDGSSILFHQLNHNKTLKMVDYSTEAGKNELLEIIREADVLIEQFRPGAMDAWGFGYEQIKIINPSVIYASLTGYGHQNDYSNVAGHDFNYLAYAGIMSLLKDEQGKPTISGAQFADISSAYMAIIAIQGALLKKARTGQGGFIDIPIADSVHPFLVVPYSLYQGGLDHNNFNTINGKTIVNYASYQCADGKWLAVGALEPKFWDNICEVIGKPEWKRSKEQELSVHVFPKNEVEAIFKTKARDEWMTIFKEKDVCVAPILEIEELENSDYHIKKKSFESFNTPNGQSLKTMRLPFKVDEK